MGAFIAFELARQLRREYHLQPAHLFVSGCRAPHRPNPHPLLYGLPEPAFMQALLRLNGTPEEVVNNKEMLELMLPVLRADFTLCETYIYSAEHPLDCSITAFGGVDDSEVTYDEIAAWSEQTQKIFTLRVLPGNHFFLRTAQPLLLQIISQELVRVITPHLQGIELQAKYASELHPLEGAPRNAALPVAYALRLEKVPLKRCCNGVVIWSVVKHLSVASATWKAAHCG